MGISQGFQWLSYLFIQAAAGRGWLGGEGGGWGVARRQPVTQEKVAREKRTASSDGFILWWCFCCACGQTSQVDAAHQVDPNTYQVNHTNNSSDIFFHRSGYGGSPCVLTSVAVSSLGHASLQLKESNSSSQRRKGARSTRPTNRPTNRPDGTTRPDAPTEIAGPGTVF